MSRTAAVGAAVRTPTPRVAPRVPSSGAARVTGARSPRATARPELRLVPTGSTARPRSRARGALLSRKATFVLLVVALLSLTTVGLLVLNTAIAVDSLQASKLREANAERAQEVQRLEQEVVRAETPAEVARAAAAAGLVPAGVAGYLVIGPEATAMRGTPEPAPEPEPLPEPPAGAPGGN
ncbi:hypothetical protein [Blastococcus sp. TF02A-35]|uniref:hypothetical protein n=1 Tax=Blastococcus sp. TF02A-35 TaxID=2559612 RepID=UPI001073434E|nr:hypothetical protein [Blastococcus sp. TF02A_35]TFV52179.1 hypothetical protein E4P43_06910 [Blastococcus sp. TF02A_35]